MTSTQQKIKRLFDSGNEIVQDYTHYSTLVKIGQAGYDEAIEKQKDKLRTKYKSLASLVSQYMILIKNTK